MYMLASCLADELSHIITSQAQAQAIQNLKQKTIRNFQILQFKLFNTTVPKKFFFQFTYMTDKQAHLPSLGMICVNISFSGSWAWRFALHVNHLAPSLEQMVQLEQLLRTLGRCRLVRIL